MKIEKIIKEYYSVKVSSTGPMPFPEAISRDKRQYRRTVLNESLVNIGFHVILAAVVIAGLYRFNNGSTLSVSITKRAEEISLNIIIDRKLEQLNSNIKILKNNINTRGSL